MACGGCGKQRQILKEAVEERDIRKVAITAIDGVAMMVGLKEKPAVDDDEVVVKDAAKPAQEPTEQKRESVAVRLRRFQS